MSSKTFEGFEVFYNGLLMSLKMVKRLFVWIFYLYLFCSFLCSYLYIGHLEIRAIFVYYIAKILNYLQFTDKAIYLKWINYDGTVVQASAAYIANSKEISAWVIANLIDVLLVFGCSLIVFILLPIGLFFFKNKADDQFKNKYVRGAKFIGFDEYSAKMEEKRDSGVIPLGFWRPTDLYGNDIKKDQAPKKIVMPASCEPKHTAVIGRPGVGKTVMFTGIISALKTKSDFKGIIYCYKGDYVVKFFDPKKDLLFNPLDKRSFHWSIFNEIETKMDIEMIAGSLFPTAGRLDSKERFFLNGAKDVFIGLLYHLYHRGLTTNRALWDYISLESKVIVEVLKHTPEGSAGLKAVGSGKGGQADGVFGVFMEHLKGFEYMAHMEGDFKIKNWLENGDGVIYISNYENLKETLKPILTLFIDLMGRQLLSMPDSDERSIYFSLDEIHTLQKMSSIVEHLTLARSKGGKFFIGTQSFSQLDEIYGASVRHTMINACGNHAIMALQDKEATIASEIINDIEYEKYNKTTSMGVSDYRDGISVAPQTKRERLVLPSQIKEIPELSAIVQLANYGSVNIAQEYKKYPLKNEAFVMRDDLLLTRADPVAGEEENERSNIQTSGMAMETEENTGGRETRREVIDASGPTVEDIDYDEIAQEQGQIEAYYEGVEY